MIDDWMDHCHHLKSKPISLGFDCGDQNLAQERGWPRQLWKVMVDKLGDSNDHEASGGFHFFCQQALEIKHTYQTSCDDVTCHTIERCISPGAHSSVQMSSLTELALTHTPTMVGMATFHCHWTLAWRRENITC